MKIKEPYNSLFIGLYLGLMFGILIAGLFGDWAVIGFFIMTGFFLFCARVIYPAYLYINGPAYKDRFKAAHKAWKEYDSN